MTDVTVDTVVLDKAMLEGTITSSPTDVCCIHYRIVPSFKQDLFKSSEIAHYYRIESGDDGKSTLKTVAKAAGRVHTRVPQNFRKERTFVHLCWIYMWCGTFSQQEKKEKFFRLNQLI